MKKTFVIVALIFSLVILGCVLPSGTSREEVPASDSPHAPNDAKEKEKLKEKLAELEKKKLEEKVAELEKKVAEQNKKTPVKTEPKTIPQSTRPKDGFARVNSPRDGYLALRSAPSTKRGRRVMKIPHGYTISVWSCGKTTVAAGRKGRWCQTVFEENPGWVFDGFLVWEGAKK